MIKRDDIISFLNKYLEISRFKDYGPNGLQVSGREEVRRIALGVSAGERLFAAAADSGADMIICHHGLFWKNSDVIVKGAMKKRLALLLARDISLAAYHLPLDAHPVSGNNAQLARALGLQRIRMFAEINGAPVGCTGSLPRAMDTEHFMETARRVIGGERFIEYRSGGGKPVRTVGIVSGGGQSHIHDAIREGIDCFITGEPAEYMQELSREEGISVLAAGHYRTEVWGVKALASLLGKKFRVRADYIDIPNEV